MEESKECKAIKLRSEKELFDPYKNQKANTFEEKGSPYMEKENEDGWVEVQKLILLPEPTKYVPNLPYLQRQ